MSLRGLQRNWNFFGKKNPMWAVLVASKEWHEEEFFATGAKEIQALMEDCEHLGINIDRKKILDFGCGVGRLSQAFAEYFEEVYGVDISPSMLEAARKYNRYKDRCSYFLNETGDLRSFDADTFDLIYSNITLQHIRPKYTKRYIKDFLRVLSPNGLLVFQLPDDLIDRKSYVRFMKRIIPRFVFDLYRQLDYSLKNLKGSLQMEMHGIKLTEVIAFVEENGGKVLEAKLDQNELTAPVPWAGVRYYVIKT